VSDAADEDVVMRRRYDNGVVSQGEKRAWTVLERADGRSGGDRPFWERRDGRFGSEGAGVANGPLAFPYHLAMPPRPAKPGSHRLQKVLADAGIAARRVCEEMIEAGRVAVNGDVVRRLPVFVNPHTDEITVDGSRVSSKADRHLYVMLHKPERTLVTLADEPGAERRTVLDLVDHPAKARLFPVGRLDYDTTGLILLTNDGDLAHRLTHPSFGIVKTYHASIKGQIDEGLIAGVRTKLGLAHEANPTPAHAAGPGKREQQPVQEITILRREPGRTLIEISISEARNREIREVLRMLGAPVKRLSRVGIGTLTLRGLPVGAWRELTRDEVHMLRRSGPGHRPAAIRRPSASVARKVRRPSRNARVQEAVEEGAGPHAEPAGRRARPPSEFAPGKAARGIGAGRGRPTSPAERGVKLDPRPRSTGPGSRPTAARATGSSGPAARPLAARATAARASGSSGPAARPLAARPPRPRGDIAGSDQRRAASGPRPAPGARGGVRSAPKGGGRRR